MIIHRGHRFPFSYRFPVFSFPWRSACFPWGGPVLKDGPPRGNAARVSATKSLNPRTGNAGRVNLPRQQDAPAAVDATAGALLNLKEAGE
jgi:hypothetical protein